MHLRSGSITASLVVLVCGVVGVRVTLGAHAGMFAADEWIVWATALGSVWVCGAVLRRLDCMR